MTTDALLPDEAAEPAKTTETTETAGTAGTAETAAEAHQTADTPESAADAQPLAPPAVPVFGAASAALDPAAIEAERAQRAHAAARRARRRRNALRWAGAVAVALALGGGTAFALTLPQRTDVPGLATAHDGRYDFPRLALPALPAGRPAPNDPQNADPGQHLADIRKLLLPRPAGATAQGVKSATDGWLADASTLFVDRAAKSDFAEYGLRHTAAESWKAADGATTTIYLLQFADGEAAPAANRALAGINVTDEDVPALTIGLTGVPSNTTASGLTVLSSGVSGVYSTVKSGGELTRYGSFASGDVVAIVIQSGPASLPFAPFQQVMVLQAELLQ